MVGTFAPRTYHYLMRHLILALMIALLPVRGWVGDVMATEMASKRASHQQSATEMVAAHAHSTADDGHFDHASMQAAAATEALPDCAGHGDNKQAVGADDAHCGSCIVCQACHTVALSPVAAATAPVLSPVALPQSPASQFASAITALGQKPPIS